MKLSRKSKGIISGFSVSEVPDVSCLNVCTDTLGEVS